MQELVIQEGSPKPQEKLTLNFSGSYISSFWRNFLITLIVGMLVLLISSHVIYFSSLHIMYVYIIFMYTINIKRTCEVCSLCNVQSVLNGKRALLGHGTAW